MKVRNGFVSNSSSSSFVVRGVKLKIDKLAKRLEIDPLAPSLFYKICGKIGCSWGNGKVVVESTKSYFNRNEDIDNMDVIVGVQLVDLDDGVPKVLLDIDDTKIRQRIEKKIGSIEKEKLQTYAQYISNDNF